MACGAGSVMEETGPEGDKKRPIVAGNRRPLRSEEAAVLSKSPMNCQGMSSTRLGAYPISILSSSSALGLKNRSDDFFQPAFLAGLICHSASSVPQFAIPPPSINILQLTILK
jgi:hypothetical protein